MRVSTFAVLLLTAGAVAAQPIQSQQHTRPDLRIVKSVATAPQGANPAVFDIVVTNVGTTGSGPFTVTDVLTPPAFFDPSNLPAQTPWVCATFPTVNPTYLTCTHPGPLAIGNSAVLQVQVQSPNPGEFENCASVSCDGDPNEENNEDCACTDFKPCEPLSIDISTGSENGGQLTAGTPDPDWTVTVGSNPPTAATTTTLSAWASSPPAQWISAANPPSATASSYIYTFDFTLGHEMVGRICSLDFQYAADNNVSITLDSIPVASLTGSASSNFTTLHSHSSPFTGSFGPHTLQATVGDTGGYTGLLIEGTLRCTCENAQ
jgi:hypothetical protein